MPLKPFDTNPPPKKNTPIFNYINWQCVKFNISCPLLLYSVKAAASCAVLNTQTNKWQTESWCLMVSLPTAGEHRDATSA